jgi:hypothetical protein
MQRDPSRLILRPRVRGSARAVRAVRNTRVFQTETRVVADEVQLIESEVFELTSSMVDETALVILKRQAISGITIVSLHSTL